MSSLDASKSAATIADYDAVAAAFDAGNRDHDVSQNIDALLEPIAAERPIIVDLGCAGGRDLVALTARGCEAWGVEGSPAFCELARRAAPGCTVLAQDFVALDLPAAVATQFVVRQAPRAAQACLRDGRRCPCPWRSRAAVFFWARSYRSRCDNNA